MINIQPPHPPPGPGSTPAARTRPITGDRRASRRHSRPRSACRVARRPRAPRRSPPRFRFARPSCSCHRLLTPISIFAPGITACVTSSVMLAYRKIQVAATFFVQLARMRYDALTPSHFRTLHPAPATPSPVSPLLSGRVIARRRTNDEQRPEARKLDPVQCPDRTGKAHWVTLPHTRAASFPYGSPVHTCTLASSLCQTGQTFCCCSPKENQQSALRLNTCMPSQFSPSAHPAPHHCL